MSNKKCPAGRAGQGNGLSPVGDLVALYHIVPKSTNDVVRLVNQAHQLEQKHRRLASKHGRIRRALERLV